MEYIDGSGPGLTVTRDIASWAARSKPSDVPDHVLDQARLLVLDGLGCGLQGAAQEWASIVADFAVSIGGREEATIWGTPHRVPGPMAPLANGTAMHAFEYDDLHPTAVLHAGAQVVPVAFAVAEMRGHQAAIESKGPIDFTIPPVRVTGSELLHAIVIGFEVGARIGLATGAGQLARGFHPSPNTGTFAAAATASRLLKLDVAQTAHALGIAGSFGGYLMAAQYGAMVKRVHPGHAGQSGITAALLAARGLTGTKAVLETPYGGFGSAYADASQADLVGVGEGLGEKWEIPDFSIKYYPCCGSNHTSLDAWWTIQRKRNLRADDVEDIEVMCSTLTAEHVGWPYSPGSVTTAQMNLAYCLAAAVSDGRLTVDQFAPTRLADPAILDIVRRIRVRPDPSIDKLGKARRHLVALRVTTSDGRRFDETCEFPKGSAGNPLPPSDVVAKFRDLASRLLTTPQVAQIERQILALGTETNEAFDVMEFTKLLVPSSPGTP